MKFFEGVENLEELRKEYHKLAFIYHPDREGGDLKKMQLINDQYDTLSKLLISNDESFSEGRKEYEQQLSEELREKLDRIIRLPGIVIEIIGNWLWVTGNTFIVRDTLKAEGFKFSHAKACWYFHKGDYFKKSGVILSLDEMRALWGQQKVETVPTDQLN